MFGWLSKTSASWPELPFEELKKRARLLVIDDESFTYLDLFKRDGYAIDQWPDVEDLQKLENGTYDLILLDVQGVGKKITPTDQGLGVLHHLRKVAPAQIVIAFSNADFSLKYQEFFELADATLAKSADYVDFKRKVDDLLRDRFSLGFYVNRIVAASKVHKGDEPKLEREARSAIVSKEPDKLSKFLHQKVASLEAVDVVLSIAKIAIEVADKWPK